MTQLEDAIKPDKKKKRFKLRMPGAFMILFLLTVVVAVIATWLILQEPIQNYRTNPLHRN